MTIVVESQPEVKPDQEDVTIKYLYWVHYEGITHEYGAMPGKIFKSEETAWNDLAEQVEDGKVRIEKRFLKGNKDAYLVELNPEQFGWLIRVEVQ